MLRRLLLVSGLLWGTAVASEGWTEFADSRGVRSFYKEMEGTKVLAMKGVGDLDVPLSKILGVILDGSKSTEWVDMLVKYDDVRQSDTVTVEMQRYDMPWPIWDREFVLRRTDTFDAANHRVSVHYKSVEDPHFPLSSDAVRGVDSGSFWTFQALPGGRTHIEIEVFVDPRGEIPSWLVNAIQKAWPRNTFDALRARALKPDVKDDPRVVAW